MPSTTPRPLIDQNVSGIYSGFKYQRFTRCAKCLLTDRPCIGLVSGGPLLCRTCLREMEDVFDLVARQVQGHAVIAKPPITPPPIQEIWIYREGTDERIGMARAVTFFGQTEIEIEQPFLFFPVEDFFVEILIQLWESEWTYVDNGGRFHIKRVSATLPEEERRLKVQLPADNAEEVMRLKIVA